MPQLVMTGADREVRLAECQAIFRNKFVTNIGFIFRNKFVTNIGFVKFGAKTQSWMEH